MADLELANGPNHELPALIDIEEIQRRLEAIFPEGLPSRNYVTREMAARTVYMMLYIGALPGGEAFTPRHVYRMTHEQAGLRDDDSRVANIIAARGRGYNPLGKRWYADNTREPIRDETLRYGLVELGAVIVDQTVATTANEGRYVLQPAFAALFSPDLEGEVLEQAISDWRDRNLNPGALARVRLLQQGMARAKERVIVHLPNGETTQLGTGLSAIITKAIVEEFLPRFTTEPAVIWISESGNKVRQRDETLARHMGINIDAAVLLPDLIAVDLDSNLRSPLIIFCEVVSTDGPITEGRKRDLLEIAAAGGHPPESVAFVTAFASRSAPPFKKLLESLATRTFAWAMNEPDVILWIEHGDDQRPVRLSGLMRTP